MFVVYVIARDWRLRTSVRAELREIGIEALGMDSVEDMNRAVASGGLPDLLVIEATTEFIEEPRIKDLLLKVPALLIASRTEKVSLPQGPSIVFRPVRIAEIISRVNELLSRAHSA